MGCMHDELQARLIQHPALACVLFTSVSTRESSSISIWVHCYERVYVIEERAVFCCWAEESKCNRAKPSRASAASA